MDEKDKQRVLDYIKSNALVDCQITILARELKISYTHASKAIGELLASGAIEPYPRKLGNARGYRVKGANG